jgi:hypothetical protein
MASDQTLRAIITVLDKTAEPLHQISARFEHYGSLVHGIGRRLAVLGEETGLARIGEHAAAAFEKVKHLGEGLLELAGPLAALGAAGSAAGLFEIVKSTAEFGEQLKLGAVAAGLSTETLSGWHYAAKLANVDVQQLDKGLQYLNRNIVEAAMGKAKDVETILQRMGFHNAPGHLVATADALRAVAAEAKHLVDSGQVQLADAMMGQLFGERAGMQLLPMFAQGPASIAKILESAKEHGLALTQEQAENASKFAESYKEMGAAADGLKFAIGARLFPVLTPIIDKMTHWVDLNREWISTKIEEGVKRLSGWISSIDWDSAIAGLKETVGGARWVIQTVSDIIKSIDELVGTKTTVVLLGLAFTDLGHDVVGLGAKPAMTSVRNAMIAINLAMDANPMIAVIAAATALAAVGYEIYKNWKDVKELFNGSDGVGAILKLPGGDSGYLDPNTGQFIKTAAPDDEARAWTNRPPLTSVSRAPGRAAVGAAADTEHRVKIDISGAPQGTKTSVETPQRGNSNLDMSVNYAF